MPKHAGHPIMIAIYDSLKKINIKKDVILIADFEKKVFQLGQQRRSQTLYWLHDINKEISAFMSFSQTGMSVHSSFNEVFIRVKRAIKCLDTALQDEYVNQKQKPILNEVKDELEAYLLICEFGGINEEAM